MQIGNLKQYSKCRGFTYIGLLILVAISGIGLAGVGIVWHQDAQREREKELLFIGEEFRQAIGSYYENTPSGIKQFPSKLSDLLLDNRFPSPQRHIRKLYGNPFNASGEWQLVLQQNRIVGVFVQSEKVPIKTYGFPPQYADFAEATNYRGWKFVYSPGSISSSQTQKIPDS